jgi:transcriptional regulator with XRE-family HTH domain
MTFSEWWAKQDPQPTQAEVAAELGVDQSTVSYWLSGRCAPKTPLRIRVAKLTKGQVPIDAWDEPQPAQTKRRNRNAA